ncbi:glycosyltransferase family 2 protein [Novosphingobium mangrovi (ex Huang et al. 2023)]|uniref:Glycosyltransferase family 2 protein n=1 Tax=Novosphingobium mangrovi (ex Huang et al. 2023) TaxID=2976432 RepID=A0ABT2I0R9_9SPHN|nr:glycosyltransferase family 2 protein [Novosphingobium mangrovi (ex Huang et al. 2023)]MCT2398395.1 glycosyltransferase family 2 protein [Novosphingobium mangrovi (ex Huang et al. 2023)]
MPSSADSPMISVVIPSHNRQALLAQVLDALAAQIPQTPAFEVVVVLDGCRDGSPAMLAGRSDPFSITVVELPGTGPAKARNAGVAKATGRLLLFLDDDVIPTDRLVSAHAEAHEANPGAAVLGPYPPEPVASGERFRLDARRWWTSHFEEVAAPGHRFTYRDLLTGNLSMSRELWDEVGGLDPQFAKAREDWELGVRLMEHGAPFIYAPQALGWHQEHLTTTPNGALRRAKEEGRSDALMALKHPRFVRLHAAPRQLRKRSWSGRLRRILLPRLGLMDRPVMAAGPPLLRLVERLGLGGLRRWLDRQLRLYCYQRGSIEALGRHFATFGTGSSAEAPPPLLEIDLAEGIERAEAMLAEQRPVAVRLHHRGYEIAALPYSPAAEPWDARHLRAYLTHPHTLRKLAPILAASQFGGDPADWNGLAPLHMIGVTDFIAQLHESQRQWRRSVER